MSVKTDDSRSTAAQPYSELTFQEKIDAFLSMLHELTLQDVEATPEERRELITANLRFDQFCDAIKALFGEDIRSQDIKVIHRKLTNNPDAIVDWTEIFGYLQNGQSDDHLTVVEEDSVFMISKKVTFGDAGGDKKRRDTVQCLRLIPSIDSYLSISQRGSVSVWNNKLKLTACIDLNEQAWATSVEYLGGLRTVVASTERSINFFDHRAKGKKQVVFSVRPFPHAPQTICWVPCATVITQDTFVFGDDQGYLNFFTITSNELAPHQNKGDKKTKHENIPIDPQNLIVPIKRRKFHDDWVSKVKYFPELSCMASCSPNQSTSFYLEPVERIWDNQEIRPISIIKGVNAFEFCVRANIIVTGGVDKVLRLWHPHIWSKPTAKLTGHIFTIVDVVINEKDQHIISMSTARVFRVWDIQTLTCIQIFNDADEHPGERRIYSIGFDHIHDRLISGSCVLEAWPLTRAVQDTMQVPHTHDRPMVIALHNQVLNQVVSVCSESVLKVWEVESAKLVYSISEPHGPGIDVTALCLEANNGYRLATGGHDGSIYVWDVGSGQDLRHSRGKTTDEDLSIAGLAYCTIDSCRCILASGWHNLIKIYKDSDSSPHLSAVRQFDIDHDLPPSLINNPVRSDTNISDKSQTRQKSTHSDTITLDEIICMEVVDTSTMITGHRNGDLLIWDVTSGKITHRMNPRAVRDKSGTSSIRVNAIKVVVHRWKEPDTSQQNDDAVRRNTRGSILKVDAVGNELKVASDDGRISTAPPETLHSFNEDNALEGGLDISHNSAGAIPLKFVEMVSPPVIVSCHEDGRLYFWNFEGHLLHRVTPNVGLFDDIAVTALATDLDADVLLIGNKQGYVCLFDVSKFLESTLHPESDCTSPPMQLLSWRAHTAKVVSLDYIAPLDAFITGSADGSVRLFSRVSGHFIGYFGQVRPFVIPPIESDTVNVPYDINEKPVASRMSGIPTHHKDFAARNTDYPLTFAESRWDPFSRTQYNLEKTKTKTKDELDKSLQKKFFRAVMKPKASSDNLGAIRTTDTNQQDGVFRFLPVYRVRTPIEVQRPTGLLLADLEKVEKLDKSKGQTKKLKKISRRGNGRELSISTQEPPMSSRLPSRHTSSTESPLKTAR